MTLSLHQALFKGVSSYVYWDNMKLIFNTALICYKEQLNSTNLYYVIRFLSYTKQSFYSYSLERIIRVRKYEQKYNSRYQTKMKKYADNDSIIFLWGLFLYRSYIIRGYTELPFTYKSISADTVTGLSNWLTWTFSESQLSPCTVLICIYTKYE